jgi:DNA invertase Pin-like site-specific DNA recombinase
MKRVGYARVSSAHQKLERQLGALVTEGCSKIFSEKASGKSTKDRPELEKAINSLGTGDCLVLAEWDRATRSLLDGIALMVRIHNRGAFIKVLDRPSMDLTTPIGQGVLALLSGLAQEERQRIVSRANAGRKVAKAKGVKFGRKPKLDPTQVAHARELLSAGKTVQEVAGIMKVHRTTMARAAAA